MPMTPPPPDAGDAMTNDPSERQVSVADKKAWFKPTVVVVHRIMQTSGGSIPTPQNHETVGDSTTQYAPASA